MGVTFKYEKRLEDLESEVLNLWRRYGKEYRTLRNNYNRLQTELLRHHMVLNPVPYSTLEEFPSVYILSIEDEKDVLLFINRMSRETLSGLISEVKRYADSIPRKELVNACFEYRYKLRHRGEARDLLYAAPPEILH